jgi:hypothetical protein
MMSLKLDTTLAMSPALLRSRMLARESDGTPNGISTAVPDVEY